MISTRRTFLTRIGLATSGAVALAGCSGLSGDEGSDDATDGTDSAANSSTETGSAGENVDTSSYESEVDNTLQGAVELDSHGASVEDGTLYVQASVTVTDADGIDGDLFLRSEVLYSKIAAGSDVDILQEYESGESYDLTAQFPDVDPAKVETYRITLEAVADEQPQN